MKANQKMLERQELQRIEENEKRLARQKQLQDRMKETVTKISDAKGAEDEERAAKQKEEADERALEHVLNKQSKLAAMRNDTKNYLLKQMEEKANRKRQALELKKMQ